VLSQIKKIIPIFSVLIVGAIIAGCSAVIVMSSSWYQGLIEIDGYDQDWAGLWRFPDESPVAFAVKNHNETLYLAFRTTDMNVIRQAAFGGFAAIIDTKGGLTGRYGLRFAAPDPEIPNIQNITTAKLEPLLFAHMKTMLNGQIRAKISDGQGNIQPFKYKGAIFSYFDGDTWFLEASVPMAAMKQRPNAGGKIGVGFLTLVKYSRLASYSAAYAERSQNGFGSGPWWVKVQLAKDPSVE